MRTASFGLLVMCTVYSGCSLGVAAESGIEAQLAERYSQAARTTTAVKLSDVTDFEWDRFYVFPPYSTGAQIAAQVGPEATTRGNLSSDRYDLLIWLSDGAVVKEIPIDRAKARFPQLQEGVDASEAVFTSKLADPSRPDDSAVVLTLISP